MGTHLRVQRCARRAKEARLVVQVDRSRNLGEVLDGLRGRLEEGLGDDRGVNALLKHLLGGAKEATSKDDNGGRPIACLNILRGREIDELMVKLGQALSLYEAVLPSSQRGAGPGCS